LPTAKPFFRFTPQIQRRILGVLLILALAFAVRVLTANFIRAHFNDPGWFQAGSYAFLDRQAQAILDKQQPPFWINDPSRTDLAVYPPGYPLWMAFVYALSGLRTPTSMQRVQVILDSMSVLLLLGIGATAYSWKVGLAAGVLSALSPLLALSAATPNADAPASWLVLGAAWLMLLAAKSQAAVKDGRLLQHSVDSIERRMRLRPVAYATAAGVLLGLACWLRVNPLFLIVVWVAPLLFFVTAGWRGRIWLSGALALATMLVISPVVIRNLVVFYPEIAPTGLGVGWNLWAGIGETERGPEFGAPCCDDRMLEQDRLALGRPDDSAIGLYWPDGIRRDRERGRRALAVIKSHPIWYAGVMTRRVGGHLKFAGKPAPNVGSAGFNVTSKKCLPADWQHGVLAVVVNVLGILQSILRYVALPLMLIGIVLALRIDWRITALILSTVFYYLATLAVGHSEIRYGLPMQSLLFVFAGVRICSLSVKTASLWLSRKTTD